MTDKMMISLADLQNLSEAARNNGTQDAFLDVMLQWAEGAIKEISRLGEYAQSLEVTMDKIADSLDVEGTAEELANKVEERMKILRKVRRLVAKTYATPEEEEQPVEEEEKAVVYRNLKGDVVQLPSSPRKLK